MLTTSSDQLISKVGFGSINTPKGFSAAGIHTGMKRKRNDLGVIYCEVPANSAAVYTLSKIRAAPLKVTKESLASEGKLQALIVNSGSANACTGKQGEQDAYRMRNETAKHFGIPDQYVAVASTGVIGERLPMDLILQGISNLHPSAASAQADHFCQSMLTTDTGTKQVCYRVNISGVDVTIGGAAKGSGMIHPNMATMLGFLTTDANIEQRALEWALKEATDKTFNRITVDGETSTNDMVVVMASGLADNETLTPEHPEWHKFIEAVRLTCEDLAKAIARDGEGATKLIEVEVRGAKSDKDAEMTAKQIAGSDLVKTAVFGRDANWGRIIGAIGKSEAEINPDNIDISLGPIQMVQCSQATAFSEQEAKAYMGNDSVTIGIHLHMGDGVGKAWGCDLTYDYIRINASYRT